MLVQDQRLITIVNIALGAALLISGLVVLRDAVTFAYIGAEETLPSEGIAEPQPRQLKRAFLDYAPVLGNNVFGFPAGRLSPLSARLSSVPTAAPHSMDITLMGIVSWPGNFGYAVLSDASGTQSVYRTGDYILGAGTLKRVDKDRITIEAGGKEVELALVELDSSRRAGNAGRAGNARSRKDRGRSSRRPGKIKDFARKTEEGSYILDKKAIQAALEKPRQIMTDARLLPHMVDGKQVGFVIREIKPGGVYQSLGLRNGDILLRVNEFGISDPQTALQAFTALRGMDRLELDVLRGGSKMTLTYEIR